MSWAGQVRAVVVKDLRQVWWLVAGLLGRLVLTVRDVTIVQPEIGESFGWAEMFVPVVILVLVTLIERPDPPGDRTAFWATHRVPTPRRIFRVQAETVIPR